MNNPAGFFPTFLIVSRKRHKTAGYRVTDLVFDPTLFKKQSPKLNFFG